LKAIGYIRLSNQDQSSYSTDNQLRNITEYCTKHHLQLTDIFEDNGESSYTFDRADFNRLETFVKKYKPEFIIVYHLDRFSRNMAEAVIKIREYRTKYGVKVRSIIDPIDMDDDDPNTVMVRAFTLMMAENELLRITKRIKDGMLQGALNGRHLNMAPYGYKNSRDAQDKPILIIDEEKAMHVQLIFRQYVAGNSIETVRALAKEIGYSQNGTSAVQRILGNQVYIGKVKLPKSGKYVPGIHEPIISEYDFWQAQNLLHHRGKIVHQANEEVFLRGVLKDYSGHLMTAGNSKGRTGKYYWYYVSRITRQNLSASKLHQQFFNLLEHLQLNTEEVAALRERISESINEKINLQSETIRTLSQALETVRSKIAMVEEKYLLNPDITQASYKKSVTQLQLKESSLLQQLMQSEKPANHLFDKMEQLLPVLSNIATLFQKLPLQKQQQFINACFDSSLSYYADSYRTTFLHPLFQPKALLLKENRLLIIEQPVRKLGEIPIRTRDGSPIETTELLYKIFVA